MIRRLFLIATLLGCAPVVESFAVGKAPADLAYANTPAVYHVAIAIPPNTVTNAGGEGVFSVSPPLPSGLALDTQTGTISGTPQVGAAQADYVITAQNSIGSSKVTLTLTVTGTPPSLTFPSDTYSFVVGRRNLTAVPVNSGGAIASCATQTALPTGLTLNTSNCAISGAATAPTAKATYILQAIYDGGVVNVDVQLEVVSVLSLFPPTVTMRGLPGESFTFAARGGVSPFSYVVLSGPGRIDPASGLFTPPNARATTILQVSDANGDTSNATASIVVPLVDGAVSAFAASESAFYLGGSFTHANPLPTPNLVAVDTTSGRAQLAFDTQESLDDEVDASLTDATSVYLVGHFTTYRGQPTHRILKLDAETGAIDRDFLSTVGFDSDAVAIVADDTYLYVIGNFSTYNGATTPVVAKIDKRTGAAVRAFRTDLDPVACTSGCSIALGPSGIYISTATAFKRAGVAVASLLRLDPQSGAQTLVLGGSGIASIDCIALDGEGLFVSGFGGASLVKLDPTSGALLGTFTAQGISGEVFALLVDGTALYAGGKFAPGIVRLDAHTGTLDPTFSAGGGIAADFNSTIYALAKTNDALFAAGNFSTYRGASVHDLAKLSLSDGSLVQDFDTSGAGAFGFHAVHTLALAGSTVIAGGEFSTYGGTLANNVAKFDLATSLADTSFEAQGGTDSQVATLSLSGDDLYLGGTFTNYAGTCVAGLARVSASSGVRQSLANPGCPAASGAIAQVAATAGGVAVTGNFTSLTNTNGNVVSTPNHAAFISTGGVTVTSYATTRTYPFSVAASATSNCIYFAGDAIIEKKQFDPAGTGCTGASTTISATGTSSITAIAVATDLYVSTDTVLAAVYNNNVGNVTNTVYSTNASVLGFFGGAQAQVTYVGKVSTLATTVGTDMYAGGNVASVTASISDPPTENVEGVFGLPYYSDDEFSPVGIGALPIGSTVSVVAPTAGLLFVGGDFIQRAGQPAFFAAFMDPITGTLVR